MLYAILAYDVGDSLPLRKTARPAHLKRLEELVASGRVIVAGPLPAIDAEDPGSAGFTGSLTVAEFESLEQAKTWAEKDPYAEAGVYESIVVKPFKQVFP